MVYRRRRTRRRPRRRFRRSRRSYRRSTRRFSRRFGRSSTRRRSIKSNGNVLSKTRSLTSGFVDVATTYLAAGSGGTLSWGSVNTWRANSWWDPRVSATGQFNEVATSYKFWSNFYNHYTIDYSTCDIYIRQIGTVTGTTDGQPLVFVLILDEGGVADGFTTWEMAINDPNATYKELYMTPDCKGHCHLHKTFSAKKFFGDPHPTGNDAASSTFGANPAEQAYYMLGVATAAKAILAQNTPTFEIKVKIKYHVKLAEPKNMENLPSSMALVQS